MNLAATRRITLEKCVDGVTLSATVEEYADGSALAIYDGGSLISEGEEGSFEAALRHVIEAGYDPVEDQRSS